MLIIVLTTSTLNNKLYVHTNFGSIFLKTASATPLPLTACNLFIFAATALVLISI